MDNGENGKNIAINKNGGIAMNGKYNKLEEAHNI